MEIVAVATAAVVGEFEACVDSRQVVESLGGVAVASSAGPRGADCTLLQ